MSKTLRNSKSTAVVAGLISFVFSFTIGAADAYAGRGPRAISRARVANMPRAKHCLRRIPKKVLLGLGFGTLLATGKASAMRLGTAPLRGLTRPPSAIRSAAAEPAVLASNATSSATKPPPGQGANATTERADPVPKPRAAPVARQPSAPPAPGSLHGTLSAADPSQAAWNHLKYFGDKILPRDGDLPNPLWDRSAPVTSPQMAKVLSNVERAGFEILKNDADIPRQGLLRSWFARDPDPGASAQPSEAKPSQLQKVLGNLDVSVQFPLIGGGFQVRTNDNSYLLPQAGGYFPGDYASGPYYQ